MSDIRFVRVQRTASSEAYIVREGEDEIGRVDIHFGQTVVYATMVVSDDERDGDDILELIELIDEQLVLSADVVRDDFVISVYRGSLLGTYNDDSFDGDEEDEEDEDNLRNGH